MIGRALFYLIPLLVSSLAYAKNSTELLGDVFAGAALGILSSWYFVTPYKNLEITFLIDENFKGLSLNYRF